MKTLRLLLLCRFAALTGGLAAWSALQAQAPDLAINVRTTVEVPLPKPRGPHPTFAMAPAVEVAADEKLVRPVPDKTLVAVYKLLQEKLEAQGYVGVADKTRPEIMITIQYGRGYLPNPYTIGSTTADVGVAAGRMVEAGGQMSGETGRSVVMRGTNDYLRRYEANIEAKMQSAEQEKLFFTIAAWDFASMQKGAKRVRYWTTTVIVDDPDHRDLNQLYDQMIAAGAQFFNRKLDREEVEIWTKLREGRVDVGTPRVVDDSKK